MERGGDVRGQRQHLLQRQAPVAADEAPERRALQVLDEQMGMLAVEHGVEAADNHGVRQSIQRLGLLGQLTQRPLVFDVLLPQQLGDGK